MVVLFASRICRAPCNSPENLARAGRRMPSDDRGPPGLSRPVQIDDSLDRATAPCAEPRVIPRKHYAINLRPVVPFRLVIRSFERADPSCVFLGRKHRRLVLLL